MKNWARYEPATREVLETRSQRLPPTDPGPWLYAGDDTKPDEQRHIPEPGWFYGNHPIDYPALFAEQWVQPTGSADSYPLDATVYHQGLLWLSRVAFNVWEPGVSNWRAYHPDGDPDEWRQPTGAHDAYRMGESARHGGIDYNSLIDANTTEPGSDPRWWKPRNWEKDQPGVWRPGIDVTVDQVLTYADLPAPAKGKAKGRGQGQNGQLYRCLQDHTTQEGWEPPNVPALWEAV